MADRESSPQRPSFQSRACENCRSRKIRCDKTIPCASCQTLGISCYAAAKTTERRPRVIVSNQYEKQIELIQERLRSIEKSIGKLSITAKSSPSSAGGESHNESLPPQYPSEAIAAFEGESSFGSQTKSISKEADITISKAFGAVADNEVAAAVSALRSTLKSNVSSQAHEAYLAKGLRRVAPQEIEQIPASTVAAVIKRLKVKPSLLFVSLGWKGLAYLERCCQKIYFPTEPVQPGTITLMHGVLFFLLKDFAGRKEDIMKEIDLSYIDLCERNFCRGLEVFETFTIPTLENILCLFMGAVKAQEESKLPLCWYYTSAGATMCRTLGYHREAVLRNDDPAVAETKRFAFWTLYAMDKNLSLNMGFSSNFQDYDIDVQYNSISKDPQLKPWDMIAVLSIELAKIQGQVYDELYSARASKKSREERNASIDRLSKDLFEMKNKYGKIDMALAWYADFVNPWLESFDFIFYSLLTVVHRSGSLIYSVTPEISPKCLEYAKESLNVHLKCFSGIREAAIIEQTDYVNWVLLYPSFTPFLVVFSHALMTLDSEDIELLENTVSSIESVRHLSVGAERLFVVCNAFLQVARVFRNSRQRYAGLRTQDETTTSRMQMATSTGANSDIQPVTDFTWSSGTFDIYDQSMDVTMLLNDWMGTSRPVGDLFSLDFNQDWGKF